MKLTFTKKDLEAMMLSKAQEMGLQVNKVEWTGYSYNQEAEVSFEAPKADTFQPIDIKEAA